MRCKNKFLLAILLCFFSPHFVIGQEKFQAFDAGLLVSDNYRLEEKTLADMNGDGKLELCIFVRQIQKGVKPENRKDRDLVIFELDGKRELDRIGVGREVGAGYRAFGTLFPVDLDGDGKDELVGVRAAERQDFPESTISIFKFLNGKLIQENYTSFRGASGLGGDVDGDGVDEVALLNWPNGYGREMQLLVLKWNDRDFELLATTYLPNMYAAIVMVDMDQDGRDEIAVTNYGSQDLGSSELALYEYNDGQMLEKAADYKFSEPLWLGHLWKENINGKPHLTVPIFGEDGLGQFDGVIFELNDRILTKKDNIRSQYESYFQGKDSRATPKELLALDKDGDGAMEVLEVEDRKRVKFLKKLKE